MLSMNKKIQKMSALSAALIVLLQPLAAHSYVGPGAGLTMLGSLWGLILAVVFVIFGLLFLPFKIMRNRMKKKKELAETEDVAAASEAQGTAARESSQDAGQ